MNEKKMLSANRIPFQWMLEIFKNCNDIDETSFYFTGEVPGDNHYLGYLPEQFPDNPYWAGYCDLKDGFEAKTAEELFNAPYYNGKSLKERWNEVNVYEIGNIETGDYIEMHKRDYPIDMYY